MSLAERILSGELKARLRALADAAVADDEPELVSALVRCLDATEAPIRRGALEAIAISSEAKRLAFPTTVVERVLTLSRDEALEVRAESAVAIATVPGVARADAEMTLLRLLKDDAAEVRAEAAAAIGDLAIDRARELLAERLEADPSPEVRFEIAFALATLRDGRALEALVAALGGQRFTDACAALERLGDARAIEPLRAHAARLFLGWPERIVAQAALYVLGAKDEALAYLFGRLEAWNRGERELAIATLGRLRAAEAFDRLARIAADPRDKSRAAAITALGELGDERARAVLERVAAEEPALAEDAKEALERLRSRRG